MQSATRDRRIRLAMAGVLGLFLAHNLVLFVRNQVVFDRWHRYAVQRPLLREVAAEAQNVDVQRRLGTYYLMRDHLAGKRLTIPRALDQEEFFFERVSRLDVEIAEGDLTLSAADAERWRRAATESRVLRSEGKDYALDLVLAPDAERFVLAPVRGTRSLLLVPDGPAP